MKTKINFYAFLIFVLSNFNLYAQSFSWINQIGESENDQSTSIAKDENDNIYTVGTFSGTVDFNSGSRVFNLTPRGNRDIFISKINKNGNFIWAKRIGGPTFESIKDISITKDGYFYVTGSFSDSCDFDPSNNNFFLKTTGVTDYDVFISKYDTSGAFIWAKKIGDKKNQNSRKIKHDNNGNVYISGEFNDTLDFDPSSAKFELKGSLNSNSFILKLNSNGDFIWAKKIGGTFNCFIYDFDVDDKGAICLTGKFDGTVDFNPSDNVQYFLQASSYDIFVCKLNKDGNFEWAINLGSGSSDLANAIVLDNEKSVYFSGYFEGRVDFDPLLKSSFFMTSTQKTDMFVCKFDSMGRFVWAKHVAGTEVEIPIEMVLDDSLNIYITGTFSGTTDFNTSSVSTFYIKANGIYSDAFILKLNKSGDFVFCKSFGSGGSTAPQGIVYTKVRDIYTAGYFDQTVDFDIDSSVFNRTSKGKYDIFVHRIRQCKNSFDTINVSTCNSFEYNGKTYKSSGKYTIVFDNYKGCDSIVTLNLKLNYLTFKNIKVNTCDGYFWNNKTYTQTGLYYDTLVNYRNCDSFISLNLKINKSNSVFDIYSCNDYLWRNKVFTTSGTYIDTVENYLKCDSTIILNLTLNKNTPTISKINDTLVTNEKWDSYQWVDCTNFQAINGETSSKLVLNNRNGKFAVKVNDSICVKTSNCITVENTKIKDYRTTNFKIYPNPSNGFFYLESDVDITRIEIIDCLGNSIGFKKSNNTISLLEANKGLYLIKIEFLNNVKLNEKIIIN